jgi:glutathione synthase/RimK-type ligase-like ATP-grasp enzyme
VGNPDSRRVVLFQEALAQREQPPAAVVAWCDLLSGKARLSDSLCPDSIVRIESPGRDFAVERALLIAGADAPDETGFARLSRRAAGALTYEKGRLLYPRQWYLGFRSALCALAGELAERPDCRVMNAPEEIALMFDKAACRERLSREGIPVPRGFGVIASYETLVARMRQAHCYRVFVKLAHGSSASGVVAYRTDGRRHQAISTVERVRENGELLLYNSRRMQVYRDAGEIAELIDALCGHRAVAEEWIPKAGLANHAFDLRVVVIGGQARHVVARLSQTPMTNLHLLNRRGDAEAVRARMGTAGWEAAMGTCAQAMRAFPGSLYAGIDLLIAPGYRRHAVLEANAFGDLLPGVLCDGADTYAMEIEALCSRLAN